MRRRSGGKFFIWLGIWSAIEGTEYLFGSLADLGLLPHWLLASLPYVGNVLSFSVVVIALLAFLDLSQDKLRRFLQGAIGVGLAIAVTGVALFLFTGYSFKVMPYNHLLAAISITVLGIVVAVPRLYRRYLVLPNRTVLSIGILVFALEAVYGNLSLPLGLPSPPEYWTRWGLLSSYSALDLLLSRTWSRSRPPPRRGLRAANCQRSVPCLTPTVVGSSRRSGSLCADRSRRVHHR